MADSVATTLTYDSPLGPITLAERDGALVGCWFSGQKYDEYNLGPSEEGTSPALEQASAWLDEYFAGKDPGDVPAVAFAGTPFQQEVWRELLAIPYGETTTYGGLAKRLAERLGRRTSARSVGGAVGKNPVSIFVPCHRVIGSSGSLTGYAGGIKRKVYLLRLEGIDVDALSVPTKGTAL